MLEVIAMLVLGKKISKGKDKRIVIVWNIQNNAILNEKTAKELVGRIVDEN